LSSAAQDFSGEVDENAQPRSGKTLPARTAIFCPCTLAAAQETRVAPLPIQPMSEEVFS
jgi:hypothetical protein